MPDDAVPSLGGIQIIERERLDARLAGFVDAMDAQRAKGLRHG
jgi:hypothetical protein